MEENTRSRCFRIFRVRQNTFHQNANSPPTKEIDYEIPIGEPPVFRPTTILFYGDAGQVVAMDLAGLYVPANGVTKFSDGRALENPLKFLSSVLEAIRGIAAVGVG